MMSDVLYVFKKTYHEKIDKPFLDLLREETYIHVIDTYLEWNNWRDSSSAFEETEDWYLLFTKDKEMGKALSKFARNLLLTIPPTGFIYLHPFTKKYIQRVCYLKRQRDPVSRKSEEWILGKIKDNGMKNISYRRYKYYHKFIKSDKGLMDLLKRSTYMIDKDKTFNQLKDNPSNIEYMLDNNILISRVLPTISDDRFREYLIGTVNIWIYSKIIKERINKIKNKDEWIKRIIPKIKNGSVLKLLFGCLDDATIYNSLSNDYKEHYEKYLDRGVNREKRIKLFKTLNSPLYVLKCLQDNKNLESAIPVAKEEFFISFLQTYMKEPNHILETVISERINSYDDPEEFVLDYVLPGIKGQGMANFLVRDFVYSMRIRLIATMVVQNAYRRFIRIDYEDDSDFAPHDIEFS